MYASDPIAGTAFFLLVAIVNITMLNVLITIVSEGYALADAQKMELWRRQYWKTRNR